MAIILGLVGVAIIPKKSGRKRLQNNLHENITPIISLFFITLIFTINDVLVFAFLGISGFLMLPAYAIIMD